MSVAPELAERLGKLLRVACSTGPDGEKLAAIGRLSAITVAHGIDWDQALNGTDPGLTREQLNEVYQAGLQAGVELERQAKANGGDWATAGYSRADEIGDRIDELRTILEAAAQSRSDNLLSGWYSTFSADMEARLKQWGTRTRVTERQWEFLNKLRSILERQDYL